MVKMKTKAHPLHTELYRHIKAIDIGKIKEDDKEELLKIFMVTKNPLIRNHIAMIFSDLKYDKSAPFIIKKIMDKDTINDNGTLVYSLENLDCKKYFLSIIEIICKMEYEARLMAYEIVKKLASSISGKLRTKALQTLEEYRNKLVLSAEDKGKNSALHFIEKTIELLRINSYHGKGKKANKLV